MARGEAGPQNARVAGAAKPGRKVTKVCVVLSGCGALDGTDVHEAVFSQLALERFGTEVIFAAPNAPQCRVADHTTGSAAEETRDMLVESARIAREGILTLSEVRAEEIDAVLLPGGFGAARSLCDFSSAGANMKILPDLERLLIALADQGKPIGAMCVATAIPAKLMQKRGVLGLRIATGLKKRFVEGIRAMGQVPVEAAPTDVIIEEQARVVTGPGWLAADSLVSLCSGIENLVAALVSLVNVRGSLSSPARPALSISALSPSGFPPQDTKERPGAAGKASGAVTGAGVAVDIFTHIMPPEYVSRVLPHASRATRAFAASTPTLANVEKRLRLLDRFPEVKQVLTLAGPVEPAGSLSSTEVAKIANDGLARLVSLYPDRFPAAVAALPLDDPDAAILEAERAIKVLGLRGVEVFTPTTNGKPLDAAELIPLYELMESLDLPIWIHPRRELLPDYAGEERSKYAIFGLWGWPYETTVAMTRLVLSGVMRRFPRLKFITHHCGGMLPLFHARARTWYDYFAARLGKDYLSNVGSPLEETFRRFYVDTAVNGSTSALQAAVAFFGPGHVLFGTDAPFDAELGKASIQDTLRSIQELPVSQEERVAILSGNAAALLRLPGLLS